MYRREILHAGLYGIKECDVIEKNLVRDRGSGCRAAADCYNNSGREAAASTAAKRTAAAQRLRYVSVAVVTYVTAAAAAA